jgi:hypothetical protein
MTRINHKHPPATGVKKKLNRAATALAAANRTSYLGIAIGVAVGVVLILVVVSVVPTVSREQVARAVRTQSVHGSSITPPGQTNLSGAVDPPHSQPIASTRSIPPEPPAAYIPVSFDKLSAFSFTVTDQMVDAAQDSPAAALRTTSQIPMEIKAFNEKNVAIKGFMLPMKFDGSLTTEFLILKSQGLCCYGVLPKITEWINVRLAGKGVKPVMDRPVTVCGTFHVGEVREHGDLVGIYRLDAEKIISD